LSSRLLILRFEAGNRETARLSSFFAL